MSPNVPAPPGWHCLADAMHGTLVSFDICPACIDLSGFGGILTRRIRDRALGDLKNQIETDPDRYAKALPLADIEAAIERGDWDEAFKAGDGIDLAAIAAEQEELEALAGQVLQEDIIDAQVIEDTYEDTGF